jgi:hypothetical protein
MEDMDYLQRTGMSIICHKYLQRTGMSIICHNYLQRTGMSIICHNYLQRTGILCHNYFDARINSSEREFTDTSFTIAVN